MLNLIIIVRVSDLERDKSNDLPIYKVIEYKDMYVVRPEYMMTFLNMIVSLNTNFAKLTLSKSREDEKYKTLDEFNKDFEDLKNSYLNNQINMLNGQVAELEKQNEAIKKASDKISEAINKIRNSYINNIESKLSKFEIKMDKEYKKIS